MVGVVEWEEEDKGAQGWRSNRGRDGQCLAAVEYDDRSIPFNE